MDIDHKIDLIKFLSPPSAAVILSLAGCGGRGASSDDLSLAAGPPGYIPWFIGGIVLFLCVVALFTIQIMIKRRETKRLGDLVRQRTSELDAVSKEFELETATLKAILNSIPDFVFCKDTDFKFTRCNKRFEDFFGVREADIIGKDDSGGLGMSEAQTRLYNDSDSAILSTGRQTVVEDLMPGANGTELICETIKVPIIKNNEIAGILGISRDITERKRTEAALLLREKMLNTLNEMSMQFLLQDDRTLEEKMTAGVGLIADMMELDGLSVWCNYTGQDEVLYTSQIYRWDKRSGTSAPRPELQNLEVSKLMSRWEDVLLGDMVLNGPVRLMDGVPDSVKTYGIASMFLAPLYFNNKYWGFVLFEDYLNERYFDEDAVSVMRSAAFLCANTIIRFEMEDKLKDAVDKAVSASQAKGRFLSNMSHEIRTPMNAIIGMTNIGISAPDIEKKDYSFAKIGDASKHLLGIINDILDVSKIEAGKFELSETIFEFEAVFKKVTNVIVYRLDEKIQKFAVYIDKDIPKVLFGDDQRLTQVVTNLASNAIKFTPDNGSIKINTYFLSEEDDACTIKIAVSDTGIGITPDQREKLFQSFHQAENDTSRKFGGTGLGLAISKSIVEMMGGEIWIESEAGRGSTFNFTVVLKRAGLIDRKPAEREERYGDIRALAVDLDPSVLTDLTGIVTGLGAYCDTAGSSAEALNLIKINGAYDVYFIDWSSPELNGMELARKIKTRTPDRADSLTIMISFLEYGMISEELKRSGIGMFVQKPLFPSKIAGIFDEYLGVTPHDPAETGDADAGVFNGRRILLAEDVEINREIVITLLEPTLLMIDCAVNGEEAVRMFSESPGLYDMIFMDLQMPEMDGYEATRLIRESGNERAADIPIVAMTANVFREDIERCLGAGMNDHIGKPIDYAVMIDKLKKYLLNTETDKTPPA